MEDSPSGLWRWLGKSVGSNLSRVRIPYPPPKLLNYAVAVGFEPTEDISTFTRFRGVYLWPLRHTTKEMLINIQSEFSKSFNPSLQAHKNAHKNFQKSALCKIVLRNEKITIIS